MGEDFSVSSVIHHNVQSIGNCTDMLNVLLQENPECIALCLTEHWKSEDQLQFYGISNFRLITGYCRAAGQHGGVAVYGRKELKYRVYKTCHDITVPYHFECSAAELTVNGIQIIIVSIYRPCRGNTELFFEKLEETLSIIDNKNKLMFVAGDFNIEMKDECAEGARLVSLFHSFGLHSTISEYTRITAECESCLDNVFTNCVQTDYTAYVLHTPISDHTAQKLEFSLPNCKQRAVIHRRIFSLENKQTFLQRVSEQDWLDVFQTDEGEVGKQWYLFMETFLRIYYECFPVKRICNKRKLPNNYTGPELADCKRRLDILLVLSRNSNSYRGEYNETRKEYNKLLVTSRHKKYDDIIKTSDNKAKSMWSIFREVTGRTNSGTLLDGDATQLAGEFNNFFLRAVPIHSTTSQNGFKIEYNMQSMFLSPITPSEFVATCKKLKTKHSSGDDDVPTSLLKYCAGELQGVLIHIINNSMKFGVFPEQLKLALIIPIYKKGNCEDMNSYRPISLLSSFSKIFEMFMCKRLLSFLIQCNRLSERQHAYLGGRSTQTAIFQFSQTILHALERGETALGIFLDLSKAYDSVNHGILLDKLNTYGIRGHAHMWFHSYLSNRYQRVLINRNGQQYKSSIEKSIVGIPQGSILGPVLFVIYMNDLCKSVETVDCSLTSFADDTNFIITSKVISDVAGKAGALFDKLESWFKFNQLIINKQKTVAILFRTRQSNITVPCNVTIMNESIKLAEATKFLGVYIDEFLTWSQHIEKLSIKINKQCHGLRVVSNYVSQSTLKTIYSASLESMVRYGIIFWGSGNIDDIFVAQKRLIRTMFQMKFRESCRGVFKANSILTVYALYIYECLMFIFKFMDKFTVHNVEHNYPTRSVNINYPYHRLTLTEKSPHYMCIKLYNNLPNEVKSISSLAQFKRSIRTLLNTAEPYTLDEYFQFVKET